MKVREWLAYGRRLREVHREACELLGKLTDRKWQETAAMNDWEILEMLLKIGLENIKIVYENEESERQAQLARERAWGVCLN